MVLCLFCKHFVSSFSYMLFVIGCFLLTAVIQKLMLTHVCSSQFRAYFWIQLLNCVCASPRIKGVKADMIELLIINGITCNARQINHINCYHCSTFAFCLFGSVTLFYLWFSLFLYGSCLTFVLLQVSDDFVWTVSCKNRYGFVSLKI